MVEHVFPVAGHKDIRVAIVVIIGYGDSHAVISISCGREPGGFGDIGEASVVILPVEAVPVFWFTAGKFFRRVHAVGQLTAVDKEKVSQPIVVVVEDGDSAAHGLDEVFLRGRRILVHKIDAMGEILSKYCLGEGHGPDCCGAGGQDHEAGDEHESIVSWVTRLGTPGNRGRAKSKNPTSVT
jgi:hypothetical protein